MNQSTTPIVSIGLAVYNGERYLEQAIESILAQSFGDFELIISDNASTDRTAAICQDYAASDPRIRYLRNAQNIGGANNENLTFTLARGQYFRWAAHDDMLKPDLLAKCVAVLDRNPDVVLCYTQIIEIDEHGQQITVTSLGKGQAATPQQRFADLLFRDHRCEPTYGLIRSDVMRRTRLQQNYTDSDRTLLCELALYGRFYEIPELLFYKRYHPKNQFVDWRARMAWFNPTLHGKITFPNWLQFADAWATVQRVPLSLYQRLCCYGVIIYWFFRQQARSMFKDALVALLSLPRPVEWRRRHAVTNWE
jgi:glycosyltransferase involved in cell wall biosynthesis